ncbi:MAG: hypothetical protein A3H98_04985 [Bacteroidetes bacterium RIFCSPLOWO2_02_FULL_36_8]|nr:MAG: hypothetical protein A3H98_04985 [Bacteroidetes bacterium RIFCSPLOWO2_02_FULL_36_8]OFY71828.1 MAG: hypothetical protein A3G23_14605 [Bacteroidetes bacterium RIFCSPLOWO2_12_FULL_37_12]
MVDLNRTLFQHCISIGVVSDRGLLKGEFPHDPGIVFKYKFFPSEMFQPFDMYFYSNLAFFNSDSLCRHRDFNKALADYYACKILLNGAGFGFNAYLNKRKNIYLLFETGMIMGNAFHKEITVDLRTPFFIPQLILGIGINSIF